MATSIDFTNLANNLGNYMREGIDKIFSDMLLGLDESLSRTGVTTLDNIKDEYVLPNVMVSDLIKPGGGIDFEGRDNALAFDSRTLKVRPFQADIKIAPQQFEATWLTHIRKSKGTYTAENFPFYEFLTAEIVKKIQRELRWAIWAGVYAANGSGSPVTKTWRDVCDGFLKKITDAVSDGDITEVATGVVSASTIVEDIEATAAGMGDDYKDQPGKVIVSRTLFDWYTHATEAVTGRSMGFNEFSGGTNKPGQPAIYVRGTNLHLVHEPALGSSQRIIATTDDNFFMGTDTVADFNKLRVQEFDRYLKVMVDGKIGVEMALANTTYKPVSVNDQA